MAGGKITRIRQVVDAEQDIGCPAAEELMLATAAGEDIISFSTRNLVVAGRSGNGVVQLKTIRFAHLILLLGAPLVQPS
ncbi:MAG: hypothetical protein RIC87_20105 [Kiloniellales bacterium]